MTAAVLGVLAAAWLSMAIAYQPVLALYRLPAG